MEVIASKIELRPPPGWRTVTAVGHKYVNNVVGWHHQLNGHESEQTPGDGEGRGSLACCNPCGHKELGTTK